MRKVLLIVTLLCGFLHTAEDQHFAIKTNSLYWAVLAPNVDFEFGVGPKMTMDLFFRAPTNHGISATITMPGCGWFSLNCDIGCVNRSKGTFSEYICTGRNTMPKAVKRYTTATWREGASPMATTGFSLRTGTSRH